MIEYEDPGDDAPEGPSDDALNRLREYLRVEKEIAKVYADMAPE